VVCGSLAQILKQLKGGGGLSCAEAASSYQQNTEELL